MANSKPTASPAATQAHDRFVWLLLALVGQPLTLTLKTGVLVRGILSGATPSASPSSSSSSSSRTADDGLSLSLRQVVYLDSKTRQPKAGADGQVKQALLVNAKDLLEVEAEGVEVDPLVATKEQQAAKEKEKKEGDSFRTDTDISADRLARLHPSGGRQLQAWGSSLEGGDDSLEGPSSSSSTFGGLESSTNGRGGGGGGWDQFAANEQRFGLKTDYEDEIYTTRLDRSGKDFKMREARAAQLEREIMKGTSSLTDNAHMAEERGEQLPDVGNEEDRYGAVIRSEGAYVPPGARKAALARLGQGQGQSGPAAGAASSPAPSSAAGSTTAGAPTPSAATPSTASPAAAASSQPTITAPSAAQGGTVDQKFRDFVTDERKRLEAKKAQLQQQAMKKEQDSKLASLLQWSQTFKNPYPLPDDLATILGKKPSNGTPGATSKTLSATSSTTAAAGSASAATSPSGGATRTIPLAPSPSPTPSALAAKKPLSSRPLIAEIPPFNPARAKAKQAELAAAAQKPTAASPAPSPAPAPVQAPSPSVSPAAGLQPKAPTSKLSATAGAFVFKPNPNAASFTPGGAGPGAAPLPYFTPAAQKKPSTPVVPPVASTSASTSSAAPSSSAPAPSAPSGPVNPFFGPKGAHKRGSSSSALQVKEDFTPFRHKTLPQPADVVPGWPFSGKPYRAIYPPHVFGAGGPPPPQQGGGPQFQQPGQGQQQQLPPHLAAQAQAQAAAFAAMQQQAQGGPHPPGSSASSTTGGAPPVGATAPTLGPNGLPLPPPPPPPHALSPAPSLPPSGAPTPVPLPGPGQFQPRAGGGGGGFGMPPQMMQHGSHGPPPPHFQPHHPHQHPHHQQHPHHPNQQQHFNHQHQQQMQQQFANMHLAQQQQGPPGGPNGLPAGVQFVPGMGLVAMQQQQGGGVGAGGNVGGPPPVQFAPQQGGGFNPAAGGQGPMFTSPSLPHPGHPGHPGHPHQQHPHAPPPPPHLAHHSQGPSHHASPAGHHRNFQGQGGGGMGQPPWFNPQQGPGQQQGGGGPGTPTMAAPNAPPPSAPSAPSTNAPPTGLSNPATAAPSSTPAPSGPPIPTAPAAAQQAGAAQGMPPQFVQQPNAAAGGA